MERSAVFPPAASQTKQHPSTPQTPVSHSRSISLDGKIQSSINSFPLVPPVQLFDGLDSYTQLVELCSRLNQPNGSGKERAFCLDAIVQIIREIPPDALAASAPSSLSQQQQSFSSSSSPFASSSLVVTPDTLIKTIRPFLLHRTRYLRTAAIRTLRHVCLAHPLITRQAWALHCDLLVTRAMDRDRRHEVERTQGFKLVRALIDKDPMGVSPALTQCLVSVAESNDDPTMRRSCLEMLRDLAARHPRLVSSCGGIRVLLLAAADPTLPDLQESILSIMLYLLNSAETRKYVKPHLDLSILWASFTEVQIKEGSTELVELWAASRGAVVEMLKTWVGLICLSDPKNLGLQTLVAALKRSASDRKRVLLDTFYDVLRSTARHKIILNGNMADFDDESSAPPASSSSSSSSSSAASDMSAAAPAGAQNNNNQKSGGDSDIPALKRRSTSLAPSLLPSLRNSLTSTGMNLSSTNASSNASSAFAAVKRMSGDNILNSFLAMLLTSLSHCGLIDVLFSLSSTHPEPSVSRRSSALLHSLMILADSLYPHQRRMRMHDSFDRLLSSFSPLSFPLISPEDHHKEAMLSADFAQRRSMLTYQHRLAFTSSIVTDTMHMRRLDEAKAQVDTAMEDKEFQQMLKETQILATKDHTRWRWDLMDLLLRGPLRLPHRLSETAQKTKFFKRILSFLSPKKKQFSELQYKEENVVFVETAKRVIDVLCSEPSGAEFLSAHGFVDHVGQFLLAETTVEPSAFSASASASASDKNRVFTPEKLAYSMSREYFAIIGRFSRHVRGIGLLVEKKIFESLYKLTENSLQRDDICQLILKNMDYTHSNVSVASHTRMLLSKAATSGSKKIRYFATLHLRTLMRQGVPDFGSWGVDLLVTQLFDQWSEVTRSSLKILDEACSSSAGSNQAENLDVLIGRRVPVALLESPIGRGLLLRCLSRPSGLIYLTECGWFNKELPLWQSGSKCCDYLNALETSISAVIYAPPNKEFGTGLTGGEGAILAPHFFGELSTTEAGCTLALQNGSFASFLETAKLKSDMIDLDDDSLQRRAALWTLGHMGSTSQGFATFFAPPPASASSGSYCLLGKIVTLAETATSISLRGTCCSVLGLIARAGCTACEALSLFGWETHSDDHNSVAVPRDPCRILSLEIVSDIDSIPSSSSPIADADLQEWDQIGRESMNETALSIMKQIELLGNPVLQDSASRALKRLRTMHPDEFCSPELLLRALDMMGRRRHRFKLQARKFLCDLFEGTMMASQEDMEEVDELFVPCDIQEPINVAVLP